MTCDDSGHVRKHIAGLAQSLERSPEIARRFESKQSTWNHECFEITKRLSGPGRWSRHWADWRGSDLGVEVFWEWAEKLAACCSAVGVLKCFCMRKIWERRWATESQHWKWATVVSRLSGGSVKCPIVYFERPQGFSVKWHAPKARDSDILG